MTGSLQEKHGVYYAVLNLKDEKGKRKPKWINTKIEIKGNNKRKAEKELRRLINEYEEKKIDYSKDINFGMYMGEWLENIKSQVELTTWKGYEYVVNKHIKPYFQSKKITLQDLQPIHIQQYYSKKLKEGLSANTIKHHHANIRKALQDALMHNIVAYNVADRVNKPKANNYNAKFYDKEQIIELLKYSKDSTIETVILLTSFYGLRRSEILGLKWKSINFNNNTITISNTVTDINGVIEKERTKNKSSHRTMPLTEDIKVHLKKLKAEQSKNQLLFGKDYIKNDYVCKWTDGKPFHPDYISHKFKELIDNNKLDSIRFHDLRHSCASLLISEGFDIKKVQEWLGHSSISTTGNIYGHIQHAAKVEMGNTLAKVLAK